MGKSPKYIHVEFRDVRDMMSGTVGVGDGQSAVVEAETDLVND